MLGDISPSVRNLLNRSNNTWTKANTFISQNTSSTPTSILYLNNITQAISTSVAQASPALVWTGHGWSNGTTSVPVAFRTYAVPTTGSPAYGNWKLDYSLNNTAYTNALTWQGNSSISRPIFTIQGVTKIVVDNSSTIDTIQSLDINSTGSQNHFTLSVGGTIRSGKSVSTQGTTEFKTAGTSPIYNFNLGSTITSQTMIAQIYSNGYYSSYNAYIGGVVTAGSADTSAQTSLSTYGSFAAKGTLVTSSTYTLAQTETFVYVDPSNSNFCTGTPTACNTYVIEATCNTHSSVGCSWYAGDACSQFNQTDETTCESGHSGCTWEESSCSGANNTDQSTCEAQDDAYGGSCSWDTSTCPSLGADQSTCEAQSGCTWNYSDCHGFDGQSQGTCEGNSGCSWVGGDCHTYDATDQSTCESGHTGCIWDSMNSVCDGVYDEGSSCSGQYDTSCTGDLCGGNYATGNCTGTFGAVCQGSANCGNITSSGTCATESGCTWTIGVTVTLPTHANANRSGTGRVYSIMHVGSTGTVSIVGQSGQPIFQYTNLTLFKKGDKVLLHNQSITFQCSLLTTQTPCQAQTGCSWLLACSSYSDQSSCEAASCAWNGDTSACEGRSTAVCSGTYTNGAYWYAHSLERGLNYVEKTSGYTLTDIDDIVNCTSGTFAITLPSAPLNNGKQYTIKNLGTGVITLNTTSSQTIDGNASGVLTLVTGDSITVISNNSNWIIA